MTCVYCGLVAQTWDHLVGLVSKSELTGYGHQLGNLVPCCNGCNSGKGNKNWQIFVSTAIENKTKRKEIERRLIAYQKKFAVQIDLQRSKKEFPRKWQRYLNIKHQIFELMIEADALAAQLRIKAKQ